MIRASGCGSRTNNGDFLAVGFPGLSHVACSGLTEVRQESAHSGVIEMAQS